MFCNRCGNELNEGQKFCNKCGEKVEEPAVIAETPELKPSEENGLKVIKKYSGLLLDFIAVIAVAFFIRFGTMAYGLEDSKFLDDIEVIDRLYGQSNVTFVIGIVIIAGIFLFVVTLLTIGHIIRSLVLIKKDYEKSVYSSSKVLKHIAKIGIVFVLLPVIMNIIYYFGMRSAVQKSYSVADAFGASELMTDEQKEQFEEQKELSMEQLKDYFDNEKLSIPISAIVLIVIGFVGAYANDRLTYEFTKEFKRQKERVMVSGMSGYVFGGKGGDSTAPDSWKCDECGAINKPNSISCSNCYHKRYE